MLVYGDAERTEPAARVVDAIGRALAAWAGLPAGLARHEQLVSAFILASELVQGLADRDFAATGADDLTEVQRDGGALLLILACAIRRSWESGFAEPAGLDEGWEALLTRLGAPGLVTMKSAEGYAFYALYPESYIEAARQSALPRNTLVIGLRSIGTGLAALVAAGLDAAPAITLRPVGHPFDRRIAVSDRLRAMILSDPAAPIAICDEGPGLSGSSFGGVADWLEAEGVARARIVFFPSHSGDLGPQAQVHHRERWQAAQRHVVEMDALILDAPERRHRLATWVAALAGGEVTDWQDISGGAWRGLPAGEGGVPPPADRQQEKRKFLCAAGGRRLLVKFSGIGAQAALKVCKARRLAEAGFTPPVRGACHGFLVEDWIESVPLRLEDHMRESVVAHLGRYLAFRATQLPAPVPGAGPESLLHMARVNIAEALGESVAGRARQLLQALFDQPHRPCDTDNRLHLWEWRMDKEGRIFKTDALDHSAAHDLIGAQDIAWDIAGAAVEFGLSRSERAALAGRVVDATGVPQGEARLDAFTLCYLAFQAGLWTNAEASSGGGEGERCARQAAGYVKRIEAMLQGFEGRQVAADARSNATAGDPAAAPVA